MKNPKIYTATISHKHGVNLYHAPSQDDLDAQILSFCREYWEDEFGEEWPSGTSVRESIDQYFESAANRAEYLEEFAPVPLKDIFKTNPVEDAKETLKKAGYILGSPFHFDDLKLRAIDNYGEERGKLTTKQCKQIADVMENRQFSAESGINWDTIDAALDEYFEGK